ncbi:MAG: hypothetical protein AB7V06_28515 [Candidatus Obscuribacterales bacterium]
MNNYRKGLLIDLSIVCLLAAAVSFHLFDGRGSSQALPEKFTVGVNYPWHKYGRDFGASAWGHAGVSEPRSRKEVEQDFAYLASLGVDTVRWFVFCDGRSGIVYGGKGEIVGLDEFVFQDMDAAIEIASRNRIRIIFVLVDFHLFRERELVDGVQVGGRLDLVNDAGLRKQLLEKVFIPVFERYADEEQVLAWEIINEPEWAMNVDFKRGVVIDRIAADTMVEFVRQAAAAAHSRSGKPVTVGSAGFAFLRLWTGANLDFLQAHYYGSLRAPLPSAGSFRFGGPIIVGEFPSASSDRDIAQYLEAFRAKGYHGAFVWSLNGNDRFSGLRAQEGQLCRWLSRSNP